MTCWQSAILIVCLILANPGRSQAGPADQVAVGIDIMIASSVTLTLTPNVIHFPAADPDTVPSIPASQNPVQVRCRIVGTGHSDVYLYASASGDLVSGGNKIPISQVSWTATGDGFLAGTMGTGQVLAGTWNISGQKTLTGTFSYYLKNDWAYGMGDYTATIIYLLYSP